RRAVGVAGDNIPLDNDGTDGVGGGGSCGGARAGWEAGEAWAGCGGGRARRAGGGAGRGGARGRRGGGLSAPPAAGRRGGGAGGGEWRSWCDQLWFPSRKSGSAASWMARSRWVSSHRPPAKNVAGTRSARR